MPFDPDSLVTARQSGYSDDEIYSHLASTDPRFDVARKAGYSLDDVAAHFAPKSGIVNGVSNAELDQFTNSPTPAVEDHHDLLTKSDPNALAPFTGEAVGFENPSVQTGEQFKAAYETPLIGKIPHLPEHVENLLDLIPNTPGLRPSSVVRAGVDIGNFLQTPEGVATLGIGSLPIAAQRLIAGAFATVALKNTPDKIQELAEAKTDDEKRQAQANLLNNTLMLAGGIHGGTAEVPTFHEEGTMVRPTGASQLQLDTAIKEGNLLRSADENTKPEILDPLVQSRDILQSKLAEQPNSTLAKTLNVVSNQLANVPDDVIAASRDRIAQSQPPSPVEAPTAEDIAATPSLEQGDTSNAFERAKAEAEQTTPLTAKAADEIPSEPISEEPTVEASTARHQKVVDAEIAGLHEATDATEALDHMEGIEDDKVRQSIAKQYGIKTEGKDANDLNMEIAEKAMEVKETEPKEAAPVSSEFQPEENGGLPKEQLSGGGTMTRRIGFSEGPGAAAETEFPETSPTGIRNAIVDQELVKKGLPPRVPVMRRAFGPLWDDAMKAFDNNENVGKNLVDELSLKNRPLTDTEDAILTHEQMNRQEDYDRAVERVNTAANPADLADAQAQLSHARDQVFKVYEVGQRAGTANARGLSARRLLIKEDYSLAKMEARQRAANSGKPLSEDQLAQVKTAHARITELEKKVADYETAKKDDLAKHYFDQLLQETKKDLKSSVKAGNKFTDFISEQAQKARDRIKSRGTRFTAGIDPVDLVDHAIIGADYIAKGVSKLADWSKEMIRDFGEGIRPYLDQIFEKSKQFHDANKGVFEKSNPSEAKAAEAVKSDGTLDHKAVYDLARKHVNAGVEGFDSVMKAVHAELKESNPELTERQVRDAFSEYGKTKFPSREEDKMKLAEYRRIGQLVSAIEDAEKGEAPKKTGLQRDKPTQSIREKMAELRAAMDKAGIETQSPEEQLASRNQARATALRNSIEDLDKRLKTGEKPPKGTPVPDSKEVESLRAERDAMKENLKEIEDTENPPQTPEEKKLSTYKKLLQTKTADLQDRISKGDYAKRVANKTQLDSEAEKLKADYAREKTNFDQGVEKIRLQNRTPSQKFWDSFIGIQRGMKLTSDVVLAKLSLAAVAREGLLTPAEEATGGVLSKALPGLAARAPREGDLSLAAEMKAKAAAFTQGMRDAAQNLQMKPSDLEATYGKQAKSPPAWYEYMGFLHAALKAPVKRAEFTRSLAKRMEHATQNGVDTNDTGVMQRLAAESYVDANRSVFMQDNVFSKSWNAAMGAAENSKIAPNLGPAIARLGRFFVPIVKVPTNIVGEVATSIHGTVTGGTRAAYAYLKGIKELPPDQADAIMRQLKKGLVGNALLLYGYLAYQNIGGFYQKGEKRSQQEVQPGMFRIGGVDMGRAFSHSTAAMLMEIGATLRRVEKKKGIGDATIAAGSGVVKQLPFVPVVTQGVDALDTEQGFHKYINNLVAGSLTPGISQHMAKVLDTPGTFPKNIMQPANVRSPKTLKDTVKAGIPVLRKDVPKKR